MEPDPRQSQPLELAPPTLAGEGEDAAKWAWNMTPNDEYLETIEVSK